MENQHIIIATFQEDITGRIILNSYPTWQQPPVPDFMPYLEGAAQIIKEHEITLDEDGIEQVNDSVLDIKVIG